jgi:hypothetical protein
VKWAFSTSKTNIVSAAAKQKGEERVGRLRVKFILL